MGMDKFQFIELSGITEDTSSCVTENKKSSLNLPVSEGHVIFGKDGFQNSKPGTGGGRGVSNSTILECLQT